MLDKIQIEKLIEENNVPVYYVDSLKDKKVYSFSLANYNNAIIDVKYVKYTNSDRFAIYVTAENKSKKELRSYSYHIDPRFNERYEYQLSRRSPNVTITERPGVVLNEFNSIKLSRIQTDSNDVWHKRLYIYDNKGNKLPIGLRLSSDGDYSFYENDTFYSFDALRYEYGEKMSKEALINAIRSLTDSKKLKNIDNIQDAKFFIKDLIDIKIRRINNEYKSFLKNDAIRIPEHKKIHDEDIIAYFKEYGETVGKYNKKSYKQPLNIA